MGEEGVKVEAVEGKRGERRFLRLWQIGSRAWHSVRYSFGSESGTPFVPVVTVLGPRVALRSLRFWIREGPPWHTVRYSFGSERAPFGTPVVEDLDQRGHPLSRRSLKSWNKEEHTCLAGR